MNQNYRKGCSFLLRLCCNVIVCTALVFASGSGIADTVPAFAFSIGSNQVPGGIWPTAVGSDEAGKVYISSLANVIQVDTNGTLLNRWGSRGTGPGQFSYAGQLAFDGAGHVFVLDSYNYRVEELDTNGNFITAWGSQGALPGQFDQPGGLAVSKSGRIYVSDSSNFRVQIFSSPGVFLKQFGTIGTNSGQFSFPGVIAVDASNNVYVVDTPGGTFDNYRVQKFDADGNFLLEWGPPGNNASGASEIGGITTDGSNNVYVADASNNRIQKFTSDGVFLSQWGSFGSGPGSFNGAMDVALDPTGNYVYVADYYNMRVDVFAYASRAPLIYQPPTNQVVPAGSTLVLDAGVFGAQPLSFQWQFNGSDIAEGTGSVLLLSNVSLTASGFYSISASNELGRTSSPGAEITVLPAVATTLPVTGISATGAVLNGNVWVGGSPTAAWFEWGTNTGYGYVGGVLPYNPQTSQLTSLLLTNLSGEVVYHYRIAASNTLGVVYGQDMSFQVGLKPTVVTLPVISADSGTVLLNATVNPGARETRVYFQWGKYAPNQYTSTNQLPANPGPMTIQAKVTGLQPGVIYQARAIASNDLGLVSGAIVNFIAPPWVLLPAPLQHVWSSLAISADGTRLAAVASDNFVYISADSGMTWTNSRVNAEPLHVVSMSADGNRLVVGNGGLATGPAYFTTNAGKWWLKANGPSRNWYAMASSGDGVRVAAVDPTAQRVLTSTNSGLDWQTNSPTIMATWDAIASSADGLRLIVAAGGTTNGPVYASTNGGLSWNAHALPVAYWQAVASSADGQILLAAVGGSQRGPIYISTNGGDSWSVTAAPITNWQSVAVSADGSELVALARSSAAPVFTSTDFGATWQSVALPESRWSALAVSADGSRLFASGDQNIVTLQTTPEPVLSMSVGQGNNSLSWVITSAPFVLQQTPDVAEPHWADSSLTPIAVLTNLRYQVSVPKTNLSGFYRLRAAP